MPHETPEAFPHAGLTRSILGAAMRVQDDLGTGLLEKAYQLCLAHVLRRTGHRVAVEPSLDITYDGLLVPDAYRLDLLVDEIVIVEIKALEALNPRHKAQMLTYLRFARKEVGLVLNFWACPLMKKGVQRAVLTVQGA